VLWLAGWLWHEREGKEEEAELLVVVGFGDESEFLLLVPKMKHAAGRQARMGERRAEEEAAESIGKEK
jgi:hypothetical protein